LARSATNCTLACVHEGAKFALVDGERTYGLEGNEMLLKKVAGQRARVVGLVRGNTITVSSVAAAS